MRYVMLITGVEQEWNAATPEETEAAMREVFAWFDRWGAAGKLAGGGERLESVTAAKTVRRDGAGEIVVTDGPYIELKEVVGGFIVLEADSLDEAVEIAGTWPNLRGSTAVEVRPATDTSR
jgi:hypothetical protein